MEYLEEYADRVRAALAHQPDVVEKKMFGSLGFMVNGHLTVGVGDGKDGSVLMVRIDKSHEPEYLKEAGASTTIMGKKTMHGWIDLTPEAVESDESLTTWIERALKFVTSLPPK